MLPAWESAPPAPAEPPVGAVVLCDTKAIDGTTTHHVFHRRDSDTAGWKSYTEPWETWQWILDNAEPGTLRLLEPGQVIA